jgi:hypothetical protein
MKYLTLAAVLLGITAALATFRSLSYHSADAARSPEPILRSERAGRASLERPRPEGAALDFVPAEGGDDSKEKQFARQAADCARHLYEKAKKQPDNVRLLRQAAAHYRACLSHEPTAGEVGSLFVEARRNLEQIEKMLARVSKRPAPKAAEKLPAAVLEEEPVARPREEPGLMFGPDGTVYRKVRGGG